MQQKSGKSVKSRVPATEAKRLLIAAAIRLMSTTPFSKITVRDVADEAGLNASTILRNFNSQEELFVAVTQELGWQLLDRSKSLGNKIVIGDPTFRYSLAYPCSTLPGFCVTFCCFPCVSPMANQT